ncbi:hypothetical protein EVAR_40799_1 [Eumeta japonica]|uniref:Uncharacterized protein n=1 Tax=Eumeta variegata TaxID=151549 RepID=A0A4C1X6D8_EUMVA|nr:hypothetical protein EVAR_40799_1 [Eumeta japonica]
MAVPNSSSSEEITLEKRFPLLQTDIQGEKSRLRVNFRPIELRRSSSEKLSSIGSCTVEATMLFFDIDSGVCSNRHRYLAAPIDYRQRSTSLPS